VGFVVFDKWISDNPALKREWQLLRRPPEARGGFRAAGSWLGLAALLAGYAGSAWWLSQPDLAPGPARAFLLCVSLGYLLFVTLVLPGRAVAFMARERGQERWQELLLTSLEPSQIVAAKLVPAFYPAPWLLALALPVLGMAAHAGRVTPDRFLLLLLVLMATGLTVATFGLWAAVRFRNPRSAMAFAYLFTGACCWGTLAWYAPFYVRGENLWWYLSPAWHTALLCLAESTASPLALPLLPEWAWCLLGNLGLTALFFRLLTRRLAHVETGGGD
jgi:ABC-type Na+ efflux pump permease subunit